MAAQTPMEARTTVDHLLMAIRIPTEARTTADRLLMATRIPTARTARIITIFRILPNRSHPLTAPMDLTDTTTLRGRTRRPLQRLRRRRPGRHLPRLRLQLRRDRRRMAIITPSSSATGRMSLTILHYLTPLLDLNKISLSEVISTESPRYFIRVS